MLRNEKDLCKPFILQGGVLSALGKKKKCTEIKSEVRKGRNVKYLQKKKRVQRLEIRSRNAN